MAQESRAQRTDDRFRETFSPRTPAKAAPPPPPAKDAGKKSKKKRSKGTTVIVLLILLLLVGGAVYAVYRIGLLDPVLVAVGMMPSQEELSMEEQQTRLDRLEEELELRESELTGRETDVTDREKAVKKREEDVEKREREQLSFAQVMAETTPERMETLKKVSAICNEMSAETAVGIVQNLVNTDEIALVIYHMTEENAAKLLALLPQATAAKVLSLMMR